MTKKKSISWGTFTLGIEYAENEVFVFEGNSISVYDTALETEKRTTSQTNDHQDGLVYSNKVVTATNDGVRIFDKNTLTLEVTQEWGTYVHDVAVTDDYIYAAGDNGVVTQLDWNGNIIHSLNISSKGINSIEADDNGESIFASTNNNKIHKLTTGPFVTGTVTDTDGNAISGATVIGASSEIATDQDGSYTLPLNTSATSSDVEITAQSLVDENTKKVSVPASNVDFTLANGDVGGQVLACSPDDLNCVDPSPLPNATVEIVGLDHVEIENYFSDISSPEEAKQKAENILEDARSWDINFDADLSVFEDVANANSEATYPLIHSPEDWGIRGDSSLTDKFIAGERPDLENPMVTVPADEEVILSLWDPTQQSTGFLDNLFEDFASEDVVGSPVDGKVDITQLGPSGEDMGTTGLPIKSDVQSVDVSEPVGITTGTEEVPVRSFTFSEGFYEVSVEDSSAAYIVKAGDPDVEELYPGYFHDLKDKQGELLDKAKKLENLSNAGILNTTTVQADENGRWSADLPSSTKTVGVTAWKGPKNLLDVQDIENADTSVQAYIQNLRSEAITQIESQLESTIDDLVAKGQDIENPEDIRNISDVVNSTEVSLSDIKSEMNQSNFENSLLDEKIYAPREPVELSVGENADIETTRVAADSFINPGIYNEIVNSQYEEFLNDHLDSLFSELDVPLDEIDSLGQLDSFLQDLLKDREEMTSRIDEMESLIERLKNQQGQLSEEELRQILGELDLNTNIENIDELNKAIAELGNIFPEDPSNEPPEDLLQRISALESTISALEETVSSPDDTSEITDGLYSGEFHFPSEVAADSTTVWIDWADSTNARQITNPETGDPVTSEPIQGSSRLSDEYWSISGSGLFGDADVVSIEDVPIPDDMAIADVRVETVAGGAPKESENSVQNPAFSGDIPSLSSVDLSTLRPAADDQVRVNLVADKSRYERIVDVSAYGPNGNPTNAEVDRVEDAALVSMNGTGAHWIEVVYQSTSGHNFTHDFQLQAVGDGGGTPAPTIQFDRGPSGTIGMAGDGVREVNIEELPAQNKANIEVVAADTDISGLHVRTLNQVSAETISVDVVAGDERVSVSKHVTVYLHKNLADDTLVWRNGDAVPHAGNPFGEYLKEDGLVLTYSDDTGKVDVSLEPDPGVLDRAQHWIDLQIQSFPSPFALIPAVLALPFIRRRWFV
ncbi:hypothetical protein [Halovenus aranensis]|uniref:hypothetical protein n=1 Tax=Halovenus aranensis TaxID=890420 RepID=UPI00117B7F73|nr:hypothetical protein [Halovenus aranensis]